MPTPKSYAYRENQGLPLVVRMECALAANALPGDSSLGQERCHLEGGTPACTLWDWNFPVEKDASNTSRRADDKAQSVCPCAVRCRGRSLPHPSWGTPFRQSASRAALRHGPCLVHTALLSFNKYRSASSKCAYMGVLHFLSFIPPLSLSNGVVVKLVLSAHLG